MLCTYAQGKLVFREHYTRILQINFASVDGMATTSLRRKNSKPRYIFRRNLQFEFHLIWRIQIAHNRVLMNFGMFNAKFKNYHETKPHMHFWEIAYYKFRKRILFVVCFYEIFTLQDYVWCCYSAIIVRCDMVASFL